MISRSGVLVFAEHIGNIREFAIFFHIMASSLDQLRKLTTVVADTGDFAGEKLLAQVTGELVTCIMYNRVIRGVCVSV